MSESVHSRASDCTTALLIYLIQIITSAVLLLATPKGSSLRFFWTLPLSYLAYQFFVRSSLLTTSQAYNAALVGLDFTFVLQCMNLLVFNGLDKEDLKHEKIIENSGGFWSYLISVLGLIHNPRGLKTRWIAKNTPQLPDFVVRQGTESSRGRYLLRQTVLLAWQWLLLDGLLALDRMEPEEIFNRLYGKGAEFRYVDATPEEWMAKLFGSILNLFIVSRLSVDMMFRLQALVAVGFGLSSPEDWPPSFGSMWDAYTLRNFWGSFMPQYLRWPLTSASSFITRSILQLPHPSPLERYTNILLVFTLSGVYFTAIDMAMGVDLLKSGAIIFFTSFAAGIMLEDAIIAIWQQFMAEPTPEKEKKANKSTTPVWLKLVGAGWVLTFLAMTTPWILYPGKRVPAVGRWLLPRSVTDLVGMPALWTVITTGAFVVTFVLGAGL